MRPVCSIWYRGWTADSCQWNRPISSVLVLLTTMLVLIMPLTEHLSNWDQFLRGGTDVEFSVLAALLFAALVILAMNRRMAQPLLAATLDWCGRVFDPLTLAPCEGSQFLAATQRVLLPVNESISTRSVCTLTTLRI